MRGMPMAALVAAMAGAGSAAAEAKLTVSSGTDRSVRVTIYAGFGDQVASFRLAPQALRIFDNGFASISMPAAPVCVRDELKERWNCGGGTISDTGRGGTIWVGLDTAKTFNVVSGRLRL